MRIAIMAAGAVGGYFGARLAAAGHDVVFFARGAHLDAIRRHGLKVESVRGDLHVKDVQVTDTADGLAQVDVVLFAVKLWDSVQAAQLVKPLAGPATRVVTVQNGVDSLDLIEPVIGKGRAVPGIAQIAAVIERPGVISHASPFHSLTFGHPDNRADPVLAAFVEAGNGAGVDFALSKQIERDLWMKFILLVALSSATAVTRLPIVFMREDEDGRRLLAAMIGEVAAVGRARGVDLDSAMVEKATAIVNGVPDTTKASMAHDLERGNRLELDWLAGRVVSLGRELNVPVPVCEAIYAALKPYRMGPPKPRGIV